MSEKQPLQFIEAEIQRDILEEPHFFREWCKINAWIELKFVDRDEWRKKCSKATILKRNGDSKKSILYLPKDLKIWETIEIIKAIDQDSYADKSELQPGRADEIRQLGVNFQQAGIYIAQYCQEFIQCKDMAEYLAEEFYNYGIALQGVKPVQKASINTLIALQLTAEEKASIDQWLLGDEAYQSRIKSLQKKYPEGIPAEILDDKRKKILEVYFRALSRDTYGQVYEGIPEKNSLGVLKNIQVKTKDQITRAIQSPYVELGKTIFGAGSRKLIREIPEPGKKKKGLLRILSRIGIEFEAERKKLWDILEIPKLKQEIEEVRRGGDKHKIAQKELEIAKKVQGAVAKFPYDKKPSYPAKILTNKEVNCAGYTLVGSSFLTELGITHVHVSMPQHSTGFLVTTDGQVYWQDFQNFGINYTKIRDEDLEGKNARGERLTCGDIVNMANDPSAQTLYFKITSSWFQDYFKDFIKTDGKVLSADHPQIGLPLSILQSLALSGNSKFQLEAARLGVALSPKSAMGYNILGTVLRDLKRNQEAVEAFDKAIELAPKYSDFYWELGKTIFKMGNSQGAVRAYQKAIELDGEDARYYLALYKAFKKLGQKKEAKAAYDKGYELDALLFHDDMLFLG